MRMVLFITLIRNRKIKMAIWIGNITKAKVASALKNIPKSRNI
jgi:hypothetical protein